MGLVVLLSGLLYWLYTTMKTPSNAPATASNASLPRGLRNNNPGNLVQSKLAWTGKVSNPTDSRFEQFTSQYYGTRALVKNLLDYRKKGFSTVQGIINRWAPPVENNTSAYVKGVAAALRVAPTAVIANSATVYADLAWSIACHENGKAAMDKHYPYARFYADALKAFNT